MLKNFDFIIRILTIQCVLPCGKIAQKMYYSDRTANKWIFFVSFIRSFIHSLNISFLFMPINVAKYLFLWMNEWKHQKTSKTYNKSTQHRHKSCISFIKSRFISFFSALEDFFLRECLRLYVISFIIFFFFCFCFIFKCAFFILIAFYFILKYFSFLLC